MITLALLFGLAALVKACKPSPNAFDELNVGLLTFIAVIGDAVWMTALFSRWPR